MIAIAQPVIDAEEINAVNEVLSSGMLAQGPRVAELEKDWAAYCGTKHALAVNSGTASLHAALFAAGVGEGDEVITTPFSFIATVNPIIMLGATPVLVDIDPETFNIDPEQIKQAITKKTKAIVPVHLYGQPADMREIQEIAQAHKLVVIEDACQAIGAEYDGKKAGNLGDLACFSLYATKNIMCGEGGIVTTNNDAYATAVRQFRQHGMSGPYQYEHLGYNFRLTDLQAAIAVEQLKKVDTFSKKRQAIAKTFNAALKSIPGLVTPNAQSGRSHVYHQYTMRATKDLPVNRDELVEKLRSKDVGAAVYYPLPLHLVEHIAHFGYKKGDFPHAEQAAAEVLSLPVHPKLSDKDVATVIAAVKDCISAT